MKRLLTVALVATAFVTTVATATAAAPSGNAIACGPGTCLQLSPSSALLDTSVGIAIDPIASLYLVSQPSTMLIGDVGKLSFSYSGTGAVTGSPRFRIAINTDGGGVVTAFFASADVIGCNKGSLTSGVLDVIHDPTCTITTPAASYANWAAFVAAHPTYRIASNDRTIVIQSGTPGPRYTISDVQMVGKSHGGR